MNLYLVKYKDVSKANDRGEYISHETDNHKEYVVATSFDAAGQRIARDNPHANIMCVKLIWSNIKTQEY